MAINLQGFQRKIHHARYTRKARDKETYLNKGQAVVVLTKDGKFPVRELGTVDRVFKDGDVTKVAVKLDSGDYKDNFPGDIFIQDLHNVDVLLETEYEETSERVSHAVASVEKLPLRDEMYYRYLDVTSNFLLVPSGRILTGAGDDSKVTLFNCYVIDVEKSPAAPDKGVDSRHAIFYHMARISEIMAHGGGVGTCISVFRPRYAPLSKTKGRSTGAVFIGNMFSGLTDFIEQGNRRGAQMLTLHDWHPDVYFTNDEEDENYTKDFIGAKSVPGFMEGNNSSVLISDEFMHAVENDLDWELKFPDTSHPDYDKDWDGDLDKWVDLHGKDSVIVYRTVKAVDMWDKLQKASKESAEPGILFITRINEYHNGQYLGKVKATNPCGEQPILGNSTCNLSAVNLGRMLKVVGWDEEGELYEIDYGLLESTVRTGVRFLDGVIDLTSYFDEEMKKWQQGERRLGLGILGLHDMLIGLRIRYGSEEGNEVTANVMRTMRDAAYRESIELAKEKGSFPLYNEEGYFQSKFVQELPEDIKADIRKYGIRNLTLLTIAPTGTTGSMTPSLLDPEGSVSTGIEPHFAMKYDRQSRIGNTVQYAGVAKAYMDRNPDRKLPDYYVGAMDLTPEEHVTVQAVAQKYVDSSISKTVNAPKGYTLEEVKRAYMLGHKLGLKGMTIYVDGSRDTQILSVSDDSEETTEIVKTVVETKPKRKGKYDDWECGNCGNEDFNMQDGCPTCTECGAQSCSL